MTKASDIVKKAANEIGVKENPAGSNKVKYNTAYYGRAVSGAAYPWCCAFIWWVFRECGASRLFFNGKKSAYCPTVEAWGKAEGLTVERSKGKPGDIVLFDFYGKGISGHIGIIEKVVGNKYQTIEGNTSSTSDDNGGAVMRRTRPLSVVRCIIRPEYDKETSVLDTSPDNVKEVQQYLNAKIKAGLDVDGKYGPLTRKAIIKYWQKVVGGLVVDGIFGAKSKATASKNNLEKGDRGELVRIMQMALICKGYLLASYGADGSFGSYTDAVLEEFQKANGLTVDGICGKNTWTKLFS